MSVNLRPLVCICRVLSSEMIMPHARALLTTHEFSGALQLEEALLAVD